MHRRRNGGGGGGGGASAWDTFETVNVTLSSCRPFIKLVHLKTFPTIANLYGENSIWYVSLAPLTEMCSYAYGVYCVATV